MIVADTSIWVDHLRADDPALRHLLESSQVLGHPFVTGEIACGHLRRRSDILALLRRLPQAPVASDPEVLDFIDRHRLMGKGIGYVDAHLLASVALAAPAKLWTRDRKLHAIAQSLHLSHSPKRH